MGLLDYFWGDTEEQKEARLAATPFKTKDRSCTDIACLILYILALLGWVAVAVVAFLDGDPEKILYPTDSSGAVCGRGENKERPVMFMFDITRCSGLSSALEGCPTPSICVAGCPGLEWSYTEGKLDAVREFCTVMTDLEWETQTIEELIQLRLCPAYLVPQQPLFDRCLPSFVRGHHGNISVVPSLWDQDHNLTSVHDGDHSNYTIHFAPVREEESLDILSIKGYVKKNDIDKNVTDEELSITDMIARPDIIVDKIFNRRKRNVDETYKVNELNVQSFQDKDDLNYEYDNNNLEYNISFDESQDRNNSKRDLTDIIDLESLRDGVEQLKKILDLKSLSEKLLWDLSVYWWILLLFLFMAFVLSFFWIG